MGPKSSRSDHESGFDAGEWIQAVEDTSTTRFSHVNPYRKRLLMNKLTGELIQEYQLQFFNQADFKGFTHDLQLRRDNRSGAKQPTFQQHDEGMRYSPYIYKVRHFRNLSVEQMCASIYNGLLYINKVQVRLKQVNDIPFQDQLYLYRACLYGFKVLHDKVGVFQITEEMIFFDQNGNAKVWMNPNLSKFQPNYEPQTYNNMSYLESQASQAQMIRNLVNIIENNTDLCSIGNCITFKEYLKTHSILDRISFSRVIQLFQMYLKEYSLTPNQYMNSIYQLYHPQDKPMRGSRQNSEADLFNFSKQPSINIQDHHLARPQQRKEVSRDKSSKNGYKTLKKSRASRQGSEVEITDPFKKDLKSRFIPPQATLNEYASTQPTFRKPQNRESFDYVSRPAQAENLIPIHHKRIDSNVHSSYTFDPQQKNSNARVNIIVKEPPVSTVHRYRSLDRQPNLLSALNSNHQRNITFSYKGQTREFGGIAGKLRQQPVRQLINQKPKIAGPEPRKTSIIDNLNGNMVGKTINITPSNSIIKASSPVEDVKTSASTLKTNKMAYYTSDSEYSLDQEIAQDMVKYLSFNPNVA